MQNPTVKDETFGTLTWDENLEWWEGKKEIRPGQIVSVSISADDVPLDTVLEQARQMFQHVQAAEPALRRSAADTLLVRYNSSWNEGPPIDANTFLLRITMTAFSVYADGSAEIDYDDGNLFLGHTISLSLDENGSVQDASVNG